MSLRNEIYFFLFALRCQAVMADFCTILYNKRENLYRFSRYSLWVISKSFFPVYFQNKTAYKNVMLLHHFKPLPSFLRLGEYLIDTPHGLTGRKTDMPRLIQNWMLIKNVYNSKETRGLILDVASVLPNKYTAILQRWIKINEEWDEEY